MVSVIGNIAHSMAGIQQYRQGTIPGQPVNIPDTRTPESVSALAKKKAEDLANLHKTYFDASKGQSAKGLDRMAPLFGAMHPRDAMLFRDLRSQTYHTVPDLHDAHVSHASETAETNANHPERQGQTTNQPGRGSHQGQTRRYAPIGMAARASLLGGASGTVAGVATEGVQQMRAQSQNFLAQMFSDQTNMVEVLGPNACFEDVLMYVMMKIAKEEEKQITEKIRQVERGSASLNGFLADRARDVGGIAGGAIGGWIGGVPGAAVGQDVGERLVNSYTGGNSQESRQIQFEKLKHMMHKQSEMMSCISNILATMHQTNKNTIQNIKG